MSSSLVINGYEFTVVQDGVEPVEADTDKAAYIVTLHVGSNGLNRPYDGDYFYIHMTLDYIYHASLAFSSAVYHARDINEWVATSIAFAALQKSGVFSIQISKPNYNGLRCFVADESTIVEPMSYIL